jgi:hypothetical protein
MQLHIPAIKEENASSKEHARVFHQLLGEIDAVSYLAEMFSPSVRLCRTNGNFVRSMLHYPAFPSTLSFYQVRNIFGY